MSQRFIRCVHCGLPHDVDQTVCPFTGKGMVRSQNLSGGQRALTRDGKEPHKPAASGSSPGESRDGAKHIKPNTSPAVPPLSAPSKRRDLVGKVIGEKYKVKGVLGEGGMGSVYEAEHVAIRRPVAIKVLHPSQARKKDAVKRFYQEARAAGGIGHPNICEVYDFGTLADGSPYLVMERLKGITLADRIAQQGGLPFDEIIDVLTQVLAGLTAAHEKGVLHRDIKPENIFINSRPNAPPTVKILDFGVSKMLATELFEDEDEMDLTKTGMVMGTPYYMSPEQARGERNLDARVDVWACGVMLYEALTGRRPFQGANYNALLLQIITTPPRPAREFRPAMPTGFEKVLSRALVRDRTERFTTTEEFRQELLSLRDPVAVRRIENPLPVPEVRPADPAKRPSRAPRVVRITAPNGVELRRDTRPPGKVQNARLPTDSIDEPQGFANAPRVQERAADPARSLKSPPPGNLPVGAPRPKSAEQTTRDPFEGLIASRDSSLPLDMTEEIPSSLEIPITFSETPYSSDVPVIDLSHIETGERRAIQELRKRGSVKTQPKVAQPEEDDDEVTRARLSPVSVARSSRRATSSKPSEPPRSLQDTLVQSAPPSFSTTGHAPVEDDATIVGLGGFEDDGTIADVAPKSVRAKTGKKSKG